MDDETKTQAPEHNDGWNAFAEYKRGSNIPTDGQLQDLGDAVPRSRGRTVALWLIGAAAVLGLMAWFAKG